MSYVNYSPIQLGWGEKKGEKDVWEDKRMISWGEERGGNPLGGGESGRERLYFFILFNV